jgi:hypothetical protein
MKQILLAITLFAATIYSCNTTQGLANIEPKSGIMELPAKGEFRIWNNKEHGSFSVTLTNASPTQSCELYTVTSSGREKWVSPSLLANSKLTVTIPANGHLFVKNFNPNILPITYSIAE